MKLKDFVGIHMYGGVELGTHNNNGDQVNHILFMLDERCYKVDEDQEDGWRSYAKDVEEMNSIMRRSSLLPFPISITCSMDEDDDMDVLHFIDNNNGKTFLSIGTDNRDSWYPVCIFDYTPENLHMNESEQQECMYYGMATNNGDIDKCKKEFVSYLQTLSEYFEKTKSTSEKALSVIDYLMHKYTPTGNSIS